MMINQLLNPCWWMDNVPPPMDDQRMVNILYIEGTEGTTEVTDEVRGCVCGVGGWGDNHMTLGSNPPD